MDFSKVVAHEVVRGTHGPPGVERFNTLEEVYERMRPVTPVSRAKKQNDDVFAFYLENEHRIFGYVEDTQCLSHGFLDNEDMNPADLMAQVMKHTRVSLPKYYLPVEEPEPGVVE